MKLTLFTVSGAPLPWRALAGLAFKQLDYSINYLEASKGEHKADAYLAINPRGTVPTLMADKLLLRDSIGILAWLDRAFPDRPLFGSTAMQAGYIWQTAMDSAQYLRAATNDVLHPLLVQGESVDRVSQDRREQFIHCVGTLKHECAQLEALLAEQHFLCGGQPTAADAVAYPDIRIIQRAIETRPSDMKAIGMHDFAEHFPKLEAWKRRIEALPAMTQTMPPHWGT